jgi:hypothetical protein
MDHKPGDFDQGIKALVPDFFSAWYEIGLKIASLAQHFVFAEGL